MSGPSEATRKERWIGIFRRVAVERYSESTRADTPELLAPLPRTSTVVGIALFCAAIALLWAAG